MTPEQMKHCVHEYFDAVAKADRSRLSDLFTSDLRWRVPQGAVEPYAGLHTGSADVIELMLGAVSGAFVPGSQKTRILNLVVGEALVVAETELVATTAQGDEYRNGYAFFFEFRDERICEIREHVDTRYAAEFFAGERT